MGQPRSLKQLLLIHELIFVLLVALAAAAGWSGVQSWQNVSQESQRINALIQEVQQTRGDLYRQMKEVFDAYFLHDPGALDEYDKFSRVAERHFWQLRSLATAGPELEAVDALQKSYSVFLAETGMLFGKRKRISREALRQSLNIDLESRIFGRYENVTAQLEQMLAAKQGELQHQLQRSKHTALLLLGVPLALAVLLLVFSRIFLQRAIARPVADVLHATTEISAGRLEHKAPLTGAAELRTLAQAINQMAADLALSQEALVRSEKQAAQGALVPMLAHNIRNPLASIRAIAQVADDPRMDQETRDSLRDIISTVDRLERWTGALLAYLLPLRPQPGSTTLQRILQGASSPLQQRLREKALTLLMPQDTLALHLEIDESLLEQVLYNLLLNAIDASPAGGTIEITLTPEPAAIGILDRGPGMPFTPEPGATTPGPSTKRFGTGLGIPFSFKACEALGCTLSFAARDGGGTCVRLELPAPSAEST